MGDIASVLLKKTHEALITEVANKQSKQAFRILFDYFAPRIKSYLLNFNLTDQKAEDLTQEVMLIVWQKANQFDSNKAKFSTWLFRIARNKCIDYLRKQKYPEVDIADYSQKLAAPENVEDGINLKDNANLITNAMQKLNAEQAAVINFSFFSDLSHAQIAKKTGIPLGTVKSRIRTAFEKLRKELGDHQ